MNPKDLILLGVALFSMLAGEDKSLGLVKQNRPIQTSLIPLGTPVLSGARSPQKRSIVWIDDNPLLSPELVGLEPLLEDSMPPFPAHPIPGYLRVPPG